jgi:hypothetical protein
MAVALKVVGGIKVPFVIKAQETSELFTCTLINIYDFEYHGVKTWGSEAEAKAEFASFLLQKGVDDIWRWDVIELDESQHKLCNVKLNNNPLKRLFLNEQGKVEARNAN